VLIVVRHGRTDANASGLLLGRRLDPPLDAVGERQAVALARAIGSVDRVVTSPLLRARQTAEALAPSAEIDERWVELDYGELDGTPLAAVPDDVFAKWRRDDGYAPPGGESLAALHDRVAAGCQELLTDAATRNIVVVTHVSPVKAAVAWALGVAPAVAWRMYVAPGSITRIATGRQAPSVQSFNVTTHLEA
jgi:broad specificity phosphatase PhoE